MADISSHQFVHWFRQSSPYINAHRGKTFVLLLEGDAFLSDKIENLIADIALLHSLGVKLVLVHGARPQLHQRLTEAGLHWHTHQDRLIAHPDLMPHLLASVGAIRSELEARLSMGLPNSPMHGAALRVMSGNLITARPMGVRDGIDFHFSGEVRKVQTEAIQDLLDKGAIVLMSPLGYSATGEAFDLDAEGVAMAAATHLSADKLILLGQDAGLKDTEGQLIRELAPREADPHLARLDSHTTLSRHLRAACWACRRGVKRAHLLSYLRDGALLQELFTRDGDGTMLTQQGYETLRGATIEDVGGLLALLKPFEDQGILVRRSRELLEAEIERFTVIDRDGSIIGCAALYPYPEQKAGELACVVIAPEYRRGQRGDALLAHIQRQARAQGLDQLFALTTHTAHWFREHGFEPASVESLPMARRALYNWQRNSRIFVKWL